MTCASYATVAMVARSRHCGVGDSLNYRDSLNVWVNVVRVNWEPIRAIIASRPGTEEVDALGSVDIAQAANRLSKPLVSSDRSNAHAQQAFYHRKLAPAGGSAIGPPPR